MVLPQIGEKDLFDSQGIEQDDINSLVEYIDQVLLGNFDNSPEDEDNDNGQNFYQSNSYEYIFQADKRSLIDHMFFEWIELRYIDYKFLRPTTLNFDILSPPPEV
ncbi:MAG: hypothetical protein ACXWV4_05100 [Flavitalea sp.]